MNLRPVVPVVLAAVLTSMLGSGCSAEADPDAPSVTHGAVARSVPVDRTPPRGRVVAAGPDVAVVVPPHWRVLRAAYPWPGVEPDHLCLVPPGPHVRGCAGVRLAWGPDLPGPNGAGLYEPDLSGGWFDGTENVLCPVGESVRTHMTQMHGPPTGAGTRAVGQHEAAWNRWQAGCDDGATFSPQVWFLPRFELLVKDLTGHAQTAGILASATFREDGASMPRAATHEDVRVTAVDGARATIRVREGEEGVTERDVDLSEAVCTGVRMVPGEVLTPVVPCARLAPLADGRHGFSAGLWFEADGSVAQVSPAPDAWSPTT